MHELCICGVNCRFGPGKDRLRNVMGRDGGQINHRWTSKTSVMNGNISAKRSKSGLTG